MADETKPPIPMVTIKRKAGAPEVTHAAAGPFSVAFEGAGPWQVPLEAWQAIEFNAGDSLEVAPDGIKTKTTKPAPVAAKE